MNRMARQRCSGRMLGTALLLALVLAVPALAANADDILGVWFNQDKDAQIEIYRCGTKYCGRIIWLKAPEYPEGSTDGIPGTPKLDHHNPDSLRKKEPILGLTIVRDFRFDEENRWTGGTVYDPKNGKTYKGKMTLAAPDRLDLRGYIGISLIGRTTSWTR